MNARITILGLFVPLTALFAACAAGSSDRALASSTSGTPSASTSASGSGSGSTGGASTGTTSTGGASTGTASTGGVATGTSSSGAATGQGGHGGNPGSAGDTAASSGTGGSTSAGTCSDGVQNEGETGVDCGGPCPPCACLGGNCALRYDGTSSYVSVPPSSTLDFTSSALTVEAWVYFDQLSNCMAIVRKGTSSSATYDYWLAKNFAPEDSVIFASYPWISENGFSAVTAGAWHHLAGVYDAGTTSAAIYVDGQSKASSAVTMAATPNGDELRIGIDWDFGCGMAGVIDEVRISSVARYSGTFVPETVFAPDASTSALWHFDEYTGTIAHDASGHGNHGTLHGATWTTEHP